jgi:dienelactone hydrolase
MEMHGRKGSFIRQVFVCLVVFLGLFWGWPGEPPRAAVVEVESRPVDIWSDGTRLSGDLWRPKGLKAADRLPAIILCHGWGGVRSHLNSAYAPFLAKAGYVVLTFDYRGWGDSDSRLIIQGKMPAPDSKGEVTLKARAVRELVDPFDQTEDIMAGLDFLSTEPGVDPDRLGLWGTSFGGGHVVYVAAQDARVKCLVSQVPSMDGGWVNRFFQPRTMASQQARGEIAPVPLGGNKVGNLRGTPHLTRIAKYRPVQSAERLKVPILIVVAEKDELMDNREHGKKVYDMVKDRVPARYEVFQGTHFEIYDKGRGAATALAIEWFDRYLKISSGQ